MAKIENEQVVNRFLLSTTYAIIAGLFLYYLSQASVRVATAALSLKLFQLMIWTGGIGTIWFAIRKFILKKGKCYYLVICALVCIAGVFLRYGNYLPYFNDMTRRILTVSALLGLLYVYELVYYFLNVNKVSK
ncbi:MAG: hypothetical protein IKJ06_00165 [Clostridia bacterium]|nr:hypothetical protein [Clostridia bacterium]